MRSWPGDGSAPRGSSLAMPSLVALAPASERFEVRVATLLRAALVLLVIANLGRIPVFSTGARDVPLLVNDLVLAILIGGGALAMAAYRVVRIDRTAAMAIAFAAIGGASAILSVP